MKKEPKPTLEIAGRPTVGPRFIHRTYSVSHKNQFQLLECPNFVLMAPPKTKKNQNSPNIGFTVLMDPYGLLCYLSWNLSFKWSHWFIYLMIYVFIHFK